MSFNKINSFEVDIVPIQDNDRVYHLSFNINNNSFYLFPCYIEKFTNNVLDDMKNIIDGKEKVIDLNFNYNYNLIEFRKDFIRFFLMNKNVSLYPLHQEITVFYENNNIVRNSLRTFLDKIKDRRDIFDEYYSSDFEDDEDV